MVEPAARSERVEVGFITWIRDSEARWYADDYGE